MGLAIYVFPDIESYDQNNLFYCSEKIFLSTELQSKILELKESALSSFISC